MAVKRERPQQGIPGELHTPDGRVLRLKLPGGADAAEGGGSAEPKPAAEPREESQPDEDDPDPA